MSPYVGARAAGRTDVGKPMNSESHIYRGVHTTSGVRVTVDQYLLLDPALTAPNSSPGTPSPYRGAALQVIAYAMLAYDLGELAADALCGAFMTYLRWRLPPESGGGDWAMSSHEIRAWYRRHSQVAPRTVVAPGPPTWSDIFTEQLAVTES